LNPLGVEYLAEKARAITTLDKEVKVTRCGLEVGLMLVGKYFGETTILRASSQFENRK